GQARREARYGISGERRNAPEGPIRPTRRAGFFSAVALSHLARGTRTATLGRFVPRRKIDPVG
ncbi:MAG TPA: hypothetical protein PLG99_09155, partial [Kaistiaceae bacterium]|nr:hypothetical protein [Kaistiaceae bacterium]